MFLYLVQHAEAKREEDDPERPLSEKGWNEIRKVADYASAHRVLRVARVLHSGKTRARQTADVLAEAIRPAPTIEEADGLDPLAEPQIWAGRLAEGQQGLMLVGHLPHLARLASTLLCGDEATLVVSFRTGGILSLERAEQGAWSVLWMVVPGILAID